MINGYQTEEEILQNLRDAGCNEETVKAFIQELRAGEGAKGMKLLQKHRRGLLDDLHLEEKKISCLDYLIFQLQKQIRKGG